MAHKRGASAGFQGEPLVDIWDGWNTGKLSGNSPTANLMDGRCPYRPGFGVSPAGPLFNAASGGAVGVLAFSATAGRIVQSWASAAAAVGHISNNVGPWSPPLWQQFGAAGAPALSLLPPRREYRMDYLPRIVVVGTAEVACGAAYDGRAYLGGNNDPAVVWSSRPAVNAGRWMPRYRLVALGPLTDGPDSGLAPAAFHQLSLRYTEGVTPRLEWLADDDVLFSLEGDANMVVSIGVFPIPWGKYVGGPVGTTVEWGESRLRIREV